MDKLNFPPNFLESLSGEPGFDAENFIYTLEFSETPTSIRINPFKNSEIKAIARCRGAPKAII